MLCSVVALNTKSKSGYVINKIEAARILSDLLQVDRQTPVFWLRGDFRKNPLTRENFLRFIRAYRGKPGLETPKEIAALAVDLYGREYKKALELLDPQDRELLPLEKIPTEKKDLAEALFDLIESRPRGEVDRALVKLMARVIEQSPS